MVQWDSQHRYRRHHHAEALGVLAVAAGLETTAIYSTIHGPITGNNGTQQAQIISNVPDVSTGYHDYWVRHLGDEITFGFDGYTLGTLTPESLGPGETWVYNRPMYMILNLSVGGAWPGEPNSSTVFPAKMIVDSVRWEAA